MNTQIAERPKTVPDVLRRLPRRTRTLLAQIVTDARITVEQAVYMAMRAYGYTQEAAYAVVRPNVKDESAQQGGLRWDRALSHIDGFIPPDAAQEIVNDWSTFVLALHPEPNVRLKAIDISNRVLRRYSDEGVTLNIMGDVKLSGPDASTDATDGPVLD